jgi:hypothetical protein
VFEQEQLIGNASGLALLDKSGLKIERCLIPDRPEPADLDPAVGAA